MGDSLAGGPIGDLVRGLGGGEAAGGDGTQGASWAGAAGGHSGLVAAKGGEGVRLSGFISSGMNGSGKKRVPGDVTAVIWKKKQKIRM